MSASKDYWMEKFLEGSNPYCHSSYDYNDSYNSYDNDATEDYVDVSFEEFDRVYTYISPSGKKLTTGDKYIISGNSGPETVKIVRGTYTDKVKKEFNYKVLPIINKIEEQTEVLDKDNHSWNVNGYIIEKYKKEEHLEYFENTRVWTAGVNENNIKRFHENNPSDTFVIFDELMGNKLYLGNFFIEKKDDFIEIAIALTNDIFSPYTIKQECFDFLSKFIVVIRDFLLKIYLYDKCKYCISLEHAGPYEHEMYFLGILNSSGIMHVGAKVGMSCWRYYFN